MFNYVKEYRKNPRKNRIEEFNNHEQNTYCILLASATI